LKLAIIEKELQAKISEIKQEKELFSEQIKAFDINQLKLEKQLKLYEQMITETVEEEISEGQMSPPDFGKNDEYDYLT